MHDREVCNDWCTYYPMSTPIARDLALLPRGSRGSWRALASLRLVWRCFRGVLEMSRIVVGELVSPSHLWYMRCRAGVNGVVVNEHVKKVSGRHGGDRVSAGSVRLNFGPSRWRCNVASIDTTLSFRLTQRPTAVQYFGLYTNITADPESNFTSPPAVRDNIQLTTPPPSAPPTPPTAPRAHPPPQPCPPNPLAPNQTAPPTATPSPGPTTTAPPTAPSPSTKKPP